MKFCLSTVAALGIIAVLYFQVHASAQDRPVLVDPSFRPELDPAVEISAVLVQSDGKVLVGYNESGGATGLLLRLNHNGSRDQSFTFDPISNEAIGVITLQPDGKLLLGTRSLNGVSPDGHLFRIVSDGTRDSSFSPAAQSGFATAILPRPDGTVLVAGAGYVSSVPRTESRRITRLLPDGQVDVAFETSLGKAYAVRTLAIDSAGRVLVGGSHANSVRPLLVRLEPNGSVDSAFQPAIQGRSNLEAAAIDAVVALPDGKFLIAGYSWVMGDRSALARLNSDGSLDATFKLESPAIWARLQRIQPDGKIIALVGEPTAYRIIRLEPDGSRDRNFALEALELTYAPELAAGPDLLVWNHFSIGGLLAPTLARLFSENAGLRSVDFDFGDEPALRPEDAWFSASESDGGFIATVRRRGDTSQPLSVDLATRSGSAVEGIDFKPVRQTLNFLPDEATKSVNIPLLDDGKVNRLERRLLLELSNPSPGVLLGAQSLAALFVFDNEIPANVDGTFRPEINGSSSVVLQQPDGKILIAGGFDRVNEVPRGHLARLNLDGSLDLSFDPGRGIERAEECCDRFQVAGMALQSDGQILVFGDFPIVNGVVRAGLARLTQNGSVDLAFEPAIETNSIVNSALSLPGGAVLVKGSLFVKQGSQTGLIRLLQDGSLDPGFQLSVPAGTSGWFAGSSLLVQSDGKILLITPDPSLEGGLPLMRRMNDGTSDSSFHSAIQAGEVVCIALQANDQLLIGGRFTLANGQQRALARLNPDGSLDTSFDCPTFDRVTDLASFPDGTIALLGTPKTLQSPHLGSDGPGLFRVEAKGVLDTEFPRTILTDNLGRLGPGRTELGQIMPQADGKLLVSGNFTMINSVPRSYLARLFKNGQQRTGVKFPQTQMSVSENSAALTLPVELFGDISEETLFSFEVQGTPSALRHFTSTAGQLSFGPLETNKTISLALRRDGLLEEDLPVTILLSNPKTNPPQTRTHVTILDQQRPGGVDPGFSPNFGGSIYRLALDVGGHLLVSGNLRLPGEAEESLRLVRLNPDGSLAGIVTPPTFAAGFYSLEQLIVQADGKLIGVRYNGFPSKGGPFTLQLARFLPDGQLDATFSSADQWQSLYPIRVQPDGKILAGAIAAGATGDSSDWCLVRFNADGSSDNLFHRSCSFPLLVAEQPDGKLIRAMWGGGVLRLNPDGTTDPAFHPPLDLIISGPGAVQPDGKILVIGMGKRTDPPSPQTVFRLLPDGSLDSTFHSGSGTLLRTSDGLETAGYISSIALQSNGKVLVAGAFTTLNGIARSNVARLNPDGSIDLSFDPGEGVSYALAPGQYGSGPPSINSILLSPDGQLLVGGDFNLVSGLLRPGLARLNGDKDFISLLAVAEESGNRIRITAASHPGRKYVLEESTDLLRWTALRTNTAVTVSITFSDQPSNRTSLPRFYRVIGD